MPGAEQAMRRRLRLPPVVPPFNKTVYRLFTFVWILAFLVALGGPIAGIYIRYTQPENNSQLLLGSRAGFAVSPRDATAVRFTVGPEAQTAGIVPGDHIIAIYGIPLPKSMPFDEATLSHHADDPAYITMSNLLNGTDNSEVPLTVRDPNGRVRDVTVTTGEQHIDAGARALHISPKELSLIDLLHVFAYPFLLWAAWLLHHRNSRDVVSSILSLGMLFRIAAEQPSSVFFAAAGIPRWINVAVYDLSNVLLITGILLFPHGDLTVRRLVSIACVPILMLLRGPVYSTYLIFFMLLAVLSLIRWLHRTPSSEQRQQIRWALLGIGAFAVLTSLSIAADYFKWSMDSFGHQLLIEMGAGICFGLAMILLQLGLLIALVKYRLYDAEFVIGRSVNFAVVTLGVAAIFAAAGDAVKQVIYNYSGNTNNEGPIIFAAALATIMVNPIQERVQRWSEKRFQKNLYLLREDLPECVRDMRETASLDEMLDEILSRVDRGVRAIRSAIVVDGCALRARGVTMAEVETWRGSKSAQDYKSDICEPTDKLFPIRVPLVPSSDNEAPLGFLVVGPRPDGSIPSREEQKALAGVSESIARAIRTVVKRQAQEQQVLDMISDNSRRIEALEALLNASGSSKRRPRTA